MDILSLDRIAVERAARCFIVAAFGFSAQAAQLDTTADAVLGQAGFTTNAHGLSASSFSEPVGIATDPISGRLFVSEKLNDRILSWPSSSAFANGEAADLVLGQVNFTTAGSDCSATKLATPSGMAVDQFGNLYVADHENNRVVTFRPPFSSGMAASGVLGQRDFVSCVQFRGENRIAGNGLYLPRGIALDSNGKLYVADTDNHRVLAFAAGAALEVGTADAIAVYGQPSPDGSFPININPPSATTLNRPSAVAVDPAGNLWIADFGNHRVLRYDVIAGNIDATADLVMGQPDFTTATPAYYLNASTFDPTALAFDASGALLIVEQYRCRILRFTTRANGAAATGVFGQAGSFTTGDCATTADALNFPTDVAFDASGNMLAVDSANNRVLRFDLPYANGAPALTSLSPESVHSGSAAFVLTVNGSGFVASSTVNWNGSPRQTQYISDKRLVAQIPASDVASGGAFAVTVSTPPPGGGLSAPVDFSIYARAPLDASADRVLGQPDFTSNGINNPQIGEEQLGGVAAASIGEGYVAIDSGSGRLFVSDPVNSRVLSWPSMTSFSNASAPDAILGQPNEYSRACNTGGVGVATLCVPVQPAVDAYGSLYVPDYGNHRVMQYVPPFTTGMAASRVFGHGGIFSNGPCNSGGISAASLCYPSGVVVSDSSLFVSDGGNARILVFVNPYADVVADAVIGQPNFSTGTPSPVSQTSLGSHAYGLSIDREGRLVVPDADRNRILRFSPPFTNGMAADLVIGQPDFTSSAPGPLAFSGFSLPLATAIDRGGNLLVADSGHNRVVRLSPAGNGFASAGLLGQPDMATGTPGTSRTKLSNPTSLALDAVGNLLVGDAGNSRVVAFDRPFAARLPKSDTTGNGKSDLVWRASDGGLSVWDMNGGTLAGFFYGVVGTEWQVIATGDFNGDGKADLFWRRAADGATYLWLMDGTRPVSFVDTGVVPLDYTPVAVADFNGDGYADVMFRRSNGQIYMWLMVNGLITSQGSVGTLPLEWTVQGTGDLDGDGRADIVWRHSITNEVYVWTMNGLAILATAPVASTLDATWQVQAIADFDGDGKDDIQWRKSDGNNYIFAMNGATVKTYVDQVDAGPEWVIQGIGDFNGDGKADIVYRHSTTGEVVIWLMQVNAPSASISLGNPGAIWSIVAPRK